MIDVTTRLDDYLYESTDGGTLGVYGRFDVRYQWHPGHAGRRAAPPESCETPEAGYAEIVDIAAVELCVGATAIARNRLSADLLEAVERRLMREAGDPSHEMHHEIAGHEAEHERDRELRDEGRAIRPR